MDFQGPNFQSRIISLHPGVSEEEVRDNTGFELAAIAGLGETAHPSAEQLAIIAELDPKNLRGKQLKDNPPGIRERAQYVMRVSY